MKVESVWSLLLCHWWLNPIVRPIGGPGRRSRHTGPRGTANTYSGTVLHVPAEDIAAGGQVRGQGVRRLMVCDFGCALDNTPCA